MSEAARRAALLLAGCAVALALLELGARVYLDWIREPSGGFYATDAELGWTPLPGLDRDFRGFDFDMHIATDARGHRTGRLGPVPEDVGQVVLCGDSYSFGWGVSDEDTLASRLDERLAAASGGALRLLNLGVPGYGTGQCALRLARFAQRHPGTPVRAMLLLHSHNDMTDDVRFLEFQLGLREPRLSWRSGAPRGWTLLRLAAADVAERLRAVGESEERRNVLQRFSLARVDAPAVSTRVGALRVESDAIGEADWDQRRTLARGSLTPLQRALLRRGIADASCAFDASGAPALHAVIHGAPDWYARAVAELVGATRCERSPVAFLGRVPAREEFQGPFFNPHSGGHFTPELNAYYAEKLADWLRAAGVGP